MPSFNKIPKLPDRFDKKTRFLTINGLVSLLVIILISFFPGKREPGSAELNEAAAIMSESLGIISRYCRANNININDMNDPDNTGLIGQEISEITTTTGHLAAKRTTVNPAFAALISSWLMEAGVHRSDTIAIACSGSFPALMVASLSASKTIGLNSRTILSIGSSSYGATNTDFTLLDIYSLLRDNNIVDSRPVGVSPGGRTDTGDEFGEAIVKKIKMKAEPDGIPFIYESDLSSNVRMRETLYFTAKNSEIKAFINIGGGFANMGTSPLSLSVKPGLNYSASLPDENERGVIFSMLEKGIPVIHLLFIEGIANEYDLVWDPVSLPVHQDHDYDYSDPDPPLILILGILYLVYFCFILIRYHRMNNIK